MKPRTTWVTVGVALALVLAVMGWVTANLLQLDADRVRTEQESVLEEQTRLSLWRIDSTMAPILSREVAALDAATYVDGPLPAPPAGVVLRFALARDAAPGSLRPLSRADDEALRRLAVDLEPDTLFAKLERPRPTTLGVRGDTEGLDVATDGAPPQAVQDAQTPYALKTQALRNEDEWSRRKANVEDNLIAYSTISRSLRDSTDEQRRQDKGSAFGPDAELDETVSVAGSGDAGEGRAGGGAEPGYRGGQNADDAEAGPHTTVIQPVWIGEHLLLLRTVGDERIEGSWLDWPALQATLLGEVADLLPDAALVPVPEAAPEDTQRLLATLPARLDPGATIPPPPTWSPLRASLLTGWLIVLAAFAALIALVKVSLGLSERRAAFVSAVTHELRTPLTTFRMYTEMLSEGMVEHKRQRYLDTLRREAVRLSGLVENVLAFARIESDQPVSQPEDLSLGDLLDRVEDRLRERCEAAGLELGLHPDEARRETRVRVDPTAVEQILFNLVDNAAKYGASAEDPRVEMSTEVSTRAVRLHVRDFGPGIVAADARRVFEPFTKAQADAAGTKPGVGLGLALSRRLARQMGGELELTPRDGGADFVLTLPRAR